MIHIVPEVKFGGGITIIDAITRNLDNEYEHTVISHNIVDHNLLISTNLIEISHNKIHHLLNVIIALSRLKRGSTIVHIHGRHGFLFFIGAKLLNIPIINQHHGYYGHRKKSKRFRRLNFIIDYFMLRFSEICVFTSTDEENEVINRYSNNIRRKLIFNRPFIDKACSNIPRLRNISRLICLGTSNIEQKGFDRQIRFFRDIAERYPNIELIHFLNMQNEQEVEEMKSMIEEYNVKNYRIMQAVPNVWKILDNRTDCVISTSRYEGRNLVLQEAFQQGFSTLATNCSGQKELLDDKWSNVLDDGDEENWIYTFEQFFNNLDIEHQKCVAAYDFVAQFGGLEKYCEEVRLLYENVRPII